MPNLQPDELYLKSREDLLPYEDARMNSLLTAVANFYTTRNDQSKWGNCLRAIAEELSRFEYFYAYDLINKLPQYLTPPDIRRRWADPCYVSAHWPSATQFDTDFRTMLVDLIAAYRLGSTVVSIEDVIFAYTGINIQVQELYKQIGGGFYDQSDRNAIKVAVNVGGSNPLSNIASLNQLQAITQSLYGAIDLAKPAHVGLEFTTIFGSNEDLDCRLSPTYLTQQMYDAVSTKMQGYYTLQDYVTINPPLFWKPSTSYINPNQANGLGLILVDSNGNLQMVTAITGDGTSATFSPPSPTRTWNENSGGITTDNNVTWTNISAAVTNIKVVSNTLTVTANIDVPLFDNEVPPVGESVKFLNLATVISPPTPISFLNSKSVTALTASSIQFTATFIDNSLVTQVAESVGNVLTITCVNDFMQGAIIQFSGLLNATYLNGVSVTVSTASGTQFTANDPTAHGTYSAFADAGTAALTDFPSTSIVQGTASSVPATPITTAQFAALASLSPPFPIQNLYQARYVDKNCTGTGITDTLRIIIREIEVPPLDEMLIQAPVLDPTNPTTTIGAWGYRMAAPQNAVLTPTQWAALPTIQFVITDTISDGVNATYTYTTLNNNPPNLSPPSFPIGGEDTDPNHTLALHEGELVTISGCTRSTLNGTARIKVVTFDPHTGIGTFQIPNTRSLVHVSEGAAMGIVAPALQSAYTLVFGQYKLLQAPPIYPANPPNMPAAPKFTVPLKWVEIAAPNSTPVNPILTGEVAGWDATHPAGLLAPRLDQVWEISGGDQFYIFGLT